MDNVCFVQSVLNLTSFDIVDCFCYVHCNCSGFRVWHQTFWSKYTSETSNNTHHVRCSNNNIEFKPSFVLDLWNQILCSYVICSGCFCFFCFCIFCKYKDTNFFTSSVRKHYCSTDLLVSVTSVTTCSDVSFDCLVKFSYC